MKRVIGTNKVLDNAISFASRWIVEKELRDYHVQNRVDAYTEVPESDIPTSENIIISPHVILKIKNNGDGSVK